MAGTETITLRLIAQDLMSGNVSKAIGSIDKLAQRGGLVGSVMQGVGQSFGQMLNPVALVANGIGAVTDALGDATTAFREDELSQAQLRTALESNIEAWDGNTDAIEATIAARMKLGFSDDEQRASLALLVAQVEDVNDALAIQRTAMDLARLKGMNLADAGNVLAKAYLGSATALSKMGIKLKKGTDGMEAVAVVQQRAAGQAEAWGKTSAGAAAAFDVKVGELQESIGRLLDAPARGLIGFFDQLIDRLAPTGSSSLPPRIQVVIDKVKELNKAVSETPELVGREAIVSLEEAGKALSDIAEIQRLGGNSTVAKWLGMTGPEFAQIAMGAGVTAENLSAIAMEVQKAGGTFEQYRSAIIAAVNDTDNVTTAIVDAWQLAGKYVGEGVEQVGEATVSTALTMETALARMHTAVRKTISGSLTTMADMKGPWKEAWKEYAQYAKDPFSPKRFENWLEKRADKAAQKAIEAANDHRPAAARKWQALADAMRDPVIVALTQINGSVFESLGIIARFKQQTAGLANILPAIGSVFGNDNDGSGAVGEATPVRRNRNRNRNNNGVNSATVNVTVIGSMSEADGQRFARVVTPHINREMARSGR